MYSPKHYRETNLERIRELIAENPFATVLAPSGLVSHLPLLIQGDAILGHMARANFQWKEFAEVGRARAIFHGPHAYISPAWYKPRPDNVPTWSYAVVHVEAEFEVLESAAAAQAMDVLIAAFEDRYGAGWRLPEDRFAVAKLMAAIIVFKLKNLRFTGKFKLNQKQDAEERARVVEGLRGTGLSEAVKLAQLINEV